jgi:hypothetical protein
MFPCQGFLGYFAIAACIVFGCSWVHWLREIAREANQSLPENQRVDLSRLNKAPASRMHRLWDEHRKLFPASRKRKYAAISLLLCALIPIAALIACISLPAIL